MIIIKKIESLPWRNRFAEHPVFFVELAYKSDIVSKWRFESLPAEIRKLITKKFPILESEIAKSTATEFLSVLCISIQREKFNTPLVAKAMENQFYFAALDPYNTPRIIIQTATFLQYLIKNPNLNAVEVTHALRNIEDQCELAALDQSARAMIVEAEKRGIPWFRISPTYGDVQFGQGHLQQRMRSTTSSNEKLLGDSYSRNKTITCELLHSIGLPAGKFAGVSKPDQAVAIAKEIGFPVVVKPATGMKGLDVIIGLNNAEDVHKYSKDILTRWSSIIVQSYFAGHDHRLLVVDGKFVAAARRVPAFVTADGKSTIKQLVDIANTDPRRGHNYYRLMNYIIIDDELKRIVARQGFNLLSIPAAGTKISLRLTANISSGGTAVDITDIIHPDNILLAERAALVLGLRIAGVDFLTTDISRSWREIGGGICEVNANIGLRPHWIGNPDRDVITPILNTIYAPGENGRIPTAMITGSNGKTTTTRMLDHILRAAGHNVGCATTDGVTINGNSIIDGDVAGPGGASVVLRDPTVTAAVLETARGGLLRLGVGLDYCDVAALLNIDNEQVGIDGINTLEQMANLKRKVIDTAKQKVILNAEDKYCLDIAKDFPVDRVILFSLNPSIESIKAHSAAGGVAITLSNTKGKEKIIIITNGKSTNVIAVEDIPSTFSGAVRHNTANALAATALGYGMNIPVKTIAAGLAAFTANIKDSSGRFNIIDDLPVPVLFDFANNAPAITCSVKAIANFKYNGNKICAITVPGNRLDDSIDDCANAVAGHFDYYICFDRLDWRRGREAGEVAGRLAKALIKKGIESNKIIQCLTPEDAMAYAAKLAKPDDFIAVFGSYTRTSLPQIRNAFEAISVNMAAA